MCASRSSIRSPTAQPTFTALPQTHEGFFAALDLFENHIDKEYSMTDCLSMHTMRSLGITEVLTHDEHFAQEGFVILYGKVPLPDLHEAHGGCGSL